MGYRTISQILIVVLALFLAFAVVIPKLEDIKLLQTKILQYKDTVEKADAYNQKLSSLIQDEQALGKTRLDALDVYLPAEIDELVVMSDINAIAKNADLLVVGLESDDKPNEYNPTTDQEEYAYDDNGNEYLVQASTLESSDFLLTTRGTYSQLKQFLVALEFNRYQLDITSFTFTTPAKSKPGESDYGVYSTHTTDPVYDYAMTLRAYSFKNK